jgi:hypothetical protein
MADPLQNSETPLEIEKLRALQVVSEILHGVGIALGLSLLWLLEAVRDRVFHLVDRVSVRARIRPASAFPPGQPRKRPPRRAG